MRRRMNITALLIKKLTKAKEEMNFMMKKILLMRKGTTTERTTIEMKRIGVLKKNNSMERKMEILRK